MKKVVSATPEGSKNRSTEPVVEKRSKTGSHNTTFSRENLLDEDRFGSLSEEGKPKRGRKKNPEIEKRNEEIRIKYANGETQEEIAKDYGIARSTVGFICKGVERKRKPKKERNQKIREEYAQGITASEIAKDYGIALSTVYQICRGVKRKVKPKNPEKEKRNEEMRRRYAKGKTLKAIAEDYGIAQTTVHRICRGVERKVNPKRGRKKNPEIEKRNEEIRRKYANGETQEEIAKDYGIARSMVGFICKGVERRVNPKRGRKKNPEIEKRKPEIRRKYANGETQKAIAEDYGIAQTTVHRICRGVERKVEPKR